MATVRIHFIKAWTKLYISSIENTINITRCKNCEAIFFSRGSIKFSFRIFSFVNVFQNVPFPICTTSYAVFLFFFSFFSFFLVSSRCDELNLLHCNKMSKHSPLGNERRKINEENASSKRVYSFASLIKRYEKS